MLQGIVGHIEYATKTSELVLNPEVKFFRKFSSKGSKNSKTGPPTYFLTGNRLDIWTHFYFH